MITIPQTYRLPTDSVFKLKLVSLSMNIPTAQLLKLMIDDLWERKQDEVSKKVTSQQADKEARRILNKAK